MRLSVNQALKTKSEAKKLSMFSKQWTPGDTVRAVYPIFWDDESGSWQLLAGAVWGYRVGDIKALNLHTAFIPALTEFDDNGNPVGDPDIAFKFSRIARAFVSGSKAAEEALVAKKNFPTEAMRKQALEEIAQRYDTKNNRNAVRPIISSPTYLITTECVVYPYKNEHSDSSAATLVSQPLSDKNIRRLSDIATDLRYTPAHTDQATDYLEVEWNFPSDPSKGQSAISSTVVGLSEEMRTSHKEPEIWKKIMGQLGLLADDSSVIVKRATRQIDENKILQALTAYSVMQSQNLDALSITENEQDVDSLVRNLDVLDHLQLTKTLTNQELLSRFDEARSKVHESSSVMENIPTPVPDTPTLNTLLNNQATDNAAVKVVQEAPIGVTEPVVPEVAVPTIEQPVTPVEQSTTPVEQPVTAFTEMQAATQSAQTVQNLNPAQAANMSDNELEDVDLGV